MKVKLPIPAPSTAPAGDEPAVGTKLLDARIAAIDHIEIALCVQRQTGRFTKGIWVTAIPPGPFDRTRGRQAGWSERSWRDGGRIGGWHGRTRKWDGCNRRSC